MKLIGSRFRTEKRKYFSIQKEIKMWDFLPEEVVITTGVDSFIRGLNSLNS